MPRRRRQARRAPRPARRATRPKPQPVRLPSASYSHETARWLVDIAEDAYRDNPASNVHTLIQGKGLLVDTQGFLAIEPKGVLIAFRGTEPTKVRDIITDVNLAKGLFVTWAPLPGLRVHRGFKLAYYKVRQQVFDAIKSIKPQHVYVTGHSLGRALATLAALDIALRATGKLGKRIFPSIRQVTMYNFGSPRVGNTVFAAFYRSVVPDSYRLVVPFDPVTRVPPSGHLLLYAHVPTLHRLPRLTLADSLNPFARHTGPSGNELKGYRSQLDRE